MSDPERQRGLVFTYIWIIAFKSMITELYSILPQRIGIYSRM